jgi:hypothetical protein
MASALLGQVQNYARKRYGSHPNESLFYTHALSLPLFLALGGDIVGHWRQWTTSPTVEAVAPYLAQLPLVSSLPVMWLLVIVNVVTQCVTSERWPSLVWRCVVLCGGLWQCGLGMGG